MQKQIFPVFLFLISFAPFSVASPLLMAIYGVEESSHGFVASQSIVSEIALRCDTKIKLVATPSHRIDELLRSAKMDGVISAANKFTNGTPGIITVPEPLAIMPLVAYAKNADLTANGWSDLKDHKVAYNSSLVTVGKKLKEINANTVPFSSDTAALKFVGSGRADLFIGFPFTVEPILKSKELSTSGIRALQPPYEIFTVHIHILPIHKELGKCFAKALKNMHEDKTYERIMNEEF